jgi:hypothetical protein
MHKPFALFLATRRGGVQVAFVLARGGATQYGTSGPRSQGALPPAANGGTGGGRPSKKRKRASAEAHRRFEALLPAPDYGGAGAAGAAGREARSMQRALERVAHAQAAHGRGAGGGAAAGRAPAEVVDLGSDSDMGEAKGGVRCC